MKKGPSGLFMTKGAQTRQRIVAEAANLFNANGYEGISMSDVMEATGLEKGGLYRHFSGKEELAVEAFDYAWRLALETRIHDLDRIENAVDKLKQFLKNFVERRPNIQGGCPLLNTAVDADDGNRMLRDRARGALKAWQSTLTSIVRKGKKAGEIRPEVDPAQLANLIISCLEGSLMISRLERSDKPLRNARAFLESHLQDHVRA
jgi:TetR/AcrR family transcriptional repressor of nem operon